MDKVEAISAIIVRFLKDPDSLSSREWEELREWAGGDPERERLLERLQDPEWVQGRLKGTVPLHPERNWELIHEKLKAPVKAAPRETRVRRLMPSYYAAAAAVLFLILAGGAYWQSLRKAGRPASELVKKGPSVPVVTGGKDRAVLTLADGRRVDLDSAGAGSLGVQGGSPVLLRKGQLLYTVNSLHERPSAPAAEYNTLTTPRAGQFTVTLPDETKVWVNNASSLRYPTQFSNLERRVELQGEAYFEVSKDSRRPFRVAVLSPNGSEKQIEVLGTRFNAEAYPDEAVQRTTLVEGLVRVGLGSGSKAQHLLLHPGEQSVIQDSGVPSLSLQKGVNVNQAIAWTKGYFNFDRTDFPQAMRQLARWYDVEVEYRKMPKGLELEGKIQRGLSLAEVLKGLESEQVHFRVEGRLVIVE